MSKWDKYIVEDAPVETSGKWDKYVEQSPTAQPQDNNLKENLLMGATGVGGAAALGGAGYGIKKYWDIPNKQLQPINAQFESWRSQNPSLKGKLAEDFPTVLSNQARDITGSIQTFDDSILNSKSANLADEIASNYDTFRNSNYAKYSQAIKLGETELAKAGKSLSNVDFNQNVIQKTMDSLKYKMPESDYNGLQKMIEEESKILDVSGKAGVVEKTLPLSTVKKFKDAVASKLPSEAQREFSSNWGQYLEKNGVTALKDANTKYRAFSQQDASLRKMYDPKTGTFNYDRLTKHIESRIKNGINADFKDLMSGLEESAPSIKGASKEVYDVASQRVNSGKKVLALQAKAKSLQMWARKAEDLLMNKAAIMEKAPIRTGGIGRAIKGAMGVAKTVGRVARPFGVALQGLDAIQQAQIMSEIQKGTPGNYSMNMLGQLIKPSDEEMLASAKRGLLPNYLG